MNEQDGNTEREKWGRRALYGGIIAGLIGLIFSPELMVAGIGLAAGGVIFEQSGKKKEGKPQAA